MTDTANDQPATEKPRIAIMGEFSAGKSTLSNLLIGAPALPVKVTATQLPPVWISHGTGEAHAVGLGGQSRPVDLADIASIDVAETEFVRVYHEADTLEQCDLIDMPGISDPNMASEVWERAIGHADAVIWCTHATQAWRQSEAAVWGTLPSDLHARSLLLLTRFDKILAERDRARVVRRVSAETEGQFRAVFPISLTQALAAGEDDPVAWAASGADAFAQALMALVAELRARPAPRTAWPRASVPRSPDPESRDRKTAVPEAEICVLDTGGTAGAPGAPSEAQRVIPRRVARRSAPRASMRPPPDSGPAGAQDAASAKGMEPETKGG